MTLCEQFGEDGSSPCGKPPAALPTAPLVRFHGWTCAGQAAGRLPLTAGQPCTSSVCPTPPSPRPAHRPLQPGGQPQRPADRGCHAGRPLPLPDAPELPALLPGSSPWQATHRLRCAALCLSSARIAAQLAAAAAPTRSRPPVRPASTASVLTSSQLAPAVPGGHCLPVRPPPAAPQRLHPAGPANPGGGGVDGAGPALPWHRQRLLPQGAGRPLRAAAAAHAGANGRVARNPGAVLWVRPRGSRPAASCAAAGGGPAVRERQVGAEATCQVARPAACVHGAAGCSMQSGV